MARSCVSSHGGRHSYHFEVSFMRSLIPIIKLSTSEGPHPLTPSPCGLGFSIVIWGWSKHPDHSIPLFFFPSVLLPLCEIEDHRHCVCLTVLSSIGCLPPPDSRDYTLVMFWIQLANVRTWNWTQPFPTNILTSALSCLPVPFLSRKFSPASFNSHLLNFCTCWSLST